ncbi:transglutaminase-like domain-containing protein [Lacipirellula sp.]|uniref:transglutaminase-like domain-containing protein n=1 Tax=Lacipirellula sp. TaxID=2691419 RepID=UPI003D1430E5
MKSFRSLVYFAAAAALLLAARPVFAETKAQLQAARELIAQGEFREAEKLLKPAVDPQLPTTSEAAVILEVLDRTRADFPHDEAEITKQVRESISDVKETEIEEWRDAGKLHSKLIDGEHKYFRNAAANLFRVSEEARKRREKTPAAEKRFDLDGLIAELNTIAKTADTPAIYPVKHHVVYTLTLKGGNERLKPGATVRAWLPFPQAYRIQQTDVKLIKPVIEVAGDEMGMGRPMGQLQQVTTDSGEQVVELSPASAPQRTVYFEQVVDDKGTPPKFVAEFEFTTAAYVPTLKPEMVKPYDEESDVFTEFTAQRLPHIAFTPEVKKLVKEVVGDEKNSLKKAQLIFNWVSENLPWVSEMEYSTIPSLSKKGIAARCGDCGVQNTTFVTLCRAAGIPARWQSGFGTKPGEEGMHDWAEIYIEPWGWLPADASYGARKSDDPAVRDFFCGHMDPYRLIVNLDYGRTLHPAKTSFRSEPIDFQRGEVEVDGHNLYFNDWEWDLDCKSEPLEKAAEKKEAENGEEKE